METEPVLQSTLDFLGSVQEERLDQGTEERGVMFSGVSSSTSEIDRVLALLQNVASEIRDYQVPNEEIQDARYAEDNRLKDMFDDVQFDFEKEEVVDDVEGPLLEEVLPQNDLMPVDPKKVELWEKMKASSGKFLKRTEWNRFTRATGKYLEERFVAVKSYKTNKLSAYFYPVITFTRDDGKEYGITEADFQDVSFDVIFGILYDLKGKAFRSEEEIIALTAIVRHIKASISLAHLYDFQLGLENWSSKLFCHKPQRSLIGEEKDFVMYTVFYDADEPKISGVYPDSLGNKKRMYSHEVMLFCDDTLKMVMDGLNTRLQMDKHNVHDISAANKVLIKHFVKEIDIRLKLRNDIRFAEIKFKLRKPAGEPDVVVKVKVEYIWEPVQCSHCLVFGHTKSGCVKAMAVSYAKPKAKEVDSDGFTKVVKKQWVPKMTKDDGSSSSGIGTNVIDEIEMTTNVVSVEGRKHGSFEEPMELTDETQKEGGLSFGQMESSDGKQPQNSSPLIPTQENEVPIVEQVIHNFQPPPPPTKPPLKSILKNPNRFSALADDESKTKEGSGRALKSAKGAEHSAASKGHGMASRFTHVKSDILPRICTSVFGSWKWVSNNLFSEFGTRIILAWDENGDVMVLDVHSQYLHCFVKLRGGHQSFFVTIVYGANRGLDRKELWSGLCKAKVIMGSKPLIIMGDFNEMLFPHDGFGGSSRRNTCMEDFYRCVEDIEVLDVPYTGIHYTWTQKPHGGDGLHRKLDRIW
ncbi:hypothetical protein OSB04_016880 [Centaurea solstitialis]|uniref:Uncharacterized protein n=1 Tax=Centaurea solstitialis TaxID=347529 RepID=A0AA38TDR0_9ASTR|nr:hypothetical protein OSB04_016880 [Centaurea solstitialis]